MSSIDPFNRLVKLTARAFYDDMTIKGENQQQKAGRSDNRGAAVVVLDALTRRQWVREEDLAKDLKLHTKQLRRTLRFFEEEKLITRDHRKETAKGAKIYNAAAASVGDGQHTGREGEEKLKMHTHSYCCLDYSQLYDVVRYRLHRMRKKIKDELESRNTVQEYVCPKCNKRYTALDALLLVSYEDSDFHCESCNGVLVAESEKFGVQDLGDGDENARRRRHEKLKDMLATMEEQLKPLVAQLARVRDLPVPEFGSLQAWELKANASGRLNGDLNSNDPSKAGGFGGHVPLYGDTKVEVAFSGIDDKGDVKSIKVDAPKVLPPWMIKQGMNITKEQRGETKPDVKIGGASTATEPTDDKKSAIVDDEAKKFQEAYMKAYMEAYSKRQQGTEIKQETPNATVEREVGVKSKREYDDDGDDIEWEEDAPRSGGTAEQFKVNDLNVEAEPSEDEDDIDWEEG